METSSYVRSLFEPVVRAMRGHLLDVGHQRWGEPTVEDRKAIDQCDDLWSVGQLTARLFSAGSWRELLRPAN